MSDFVKIIKNRRSIYALGNKKIVPETRVKKIVEDCILHTPSAFNIQSAKVVLLWLSQK